MTLQRDAPPPQADSRTGWAWVLSTQGGVRLEGAVSFMEEKCLSLWIPAVCETEEKWASGGHEARRVEGGGRGVWEEWKDGWAPTTGDNTPCLEVCWVLDPCPVLALKDIIHVTQLASSLMSQKMHLQNALGRTKCIRSQVSLQVLARGWIDV